MALQGKGVLAIWNDIAEGAEEEFMTWHVKEHMPERVGLPGFLSGRRYTAIEGRPAYFNFYEVETPDTLRSPAYLAALDAPSIATQRIVSRFSATSRTLCRVVATCGRGIGGFVEILRFGEAVDPGAAARFASSLIGKDAVCAAHLFVRVDGPTQVTAETRLRGAPDATWPAILLIETMSAGSAKALRTEALGSAALTAAGLPGAPLHGTYRLDYALRCEDIAEQDVDQAQRRRAPDAT